MEASSPLSMATATVAADHEKNDSSSGPECCELQPFPILELPRELRDKIWRFALTRPTAVLIVDNKICCWRRVWQKARGPLIGFRVHCKGHFMTTRHIQPQVIRENEEEPAEVNLLLVNRQVHLECTPIFYSQNAFYFHNHDSGHPSACASVAEAVGFFSFLGNRYAQGVTRLDDIDLDVFVLFRNLLPYDVQSCVSVSSIDSALRHGNIQKLHINVNEDGLSSFIHLLADCFPNSGAGRAKTMQVEWVLGMEMTPLQIPWKSVWTFISRVRLLRDLLLNNNEKHGYAGMTVRLTPKGGLHPTTCEGFCKDVDNWTYSPSHRRLPRRFRPEPRAGGSHRSLLFQWTTTDESKNHTSSEAASSGEDESRSMQIRDDRELAKLLWQTHKNGPLHLADWSTQLEELEKTSGVNKEFVRSGDRRPIKWVSV